MTTLETNALINAVMLVLISIGLFGVIRYRIKHRQLDIVLGYAIGLAYFTVAPLWVLLFYQDLSSLNFATISSVSWEYDSESIGSLLLMVLLVIPMLAVFPFAKPPVTAGQPRRPTVRLKLWHVGALYLILSMVEFTVLDLGTVDAHWADSREAFMLEHGLLGSILIVASAAFRYAFLFLLLTRTPVARYDWKFFLLLGGFGLIDLYMTGTRILILQILLLVVVNILSERRYRLALALTCLAFPIAYGMVVFTAVRASMHAWEGKSAGAAVVAFVDAVGESNEFHKDRLSNQYVLQRLTESLSINIFAEMTEIYPDAAGYLGGTTLIKPLVFWVPRSIWPDKPINFPSQIGTRLVRPGVSLNSTPMGEAYANFGEWGVLYVPLMLLLLRQAFFTLGRLRYTQAVGIALFVLGFTVTRNGIISTGLPFAAALVICSFCQDAPAFVRRPAVRAPVRRVRPHQATAPQTTAPA